MIHKWLQQTLSFRSVYIVLVIWMSQSFGYNRLPGWWYRRRNDEIWFIYNLYITFLHHPSYNHTFKSSFATIQKHGSKLCIFIRSRQLYIQSLLTSKITKLILMRHIWTYEMHCYGSLISIRWSLMSWYSIHGFTVTLCFLNDLFLLHL